MKHDSAFDRREFLLTAGAAALGLMSSHSRAAAKKPNVIYVLADQWRAQACGYAGDPNLQGTTPNLDRLAAESVNFSHAVSCCPVCTPYRASLMTGQYPLTHGLFLNDVCLGTAATTLGRAYTQAGYDTGYIGKWHLDGHGRSNYIPPERRQGFAYWKVLECTHDYNHSIYYAGNDPNRRVWPEYDVICQTRDAQSYIKEHAGAAKPFLLVISWGPPHNPYETAPERYKKMFDAAKLKMRPNVQGDYAQDLAGYYGHIAAMDACLGDLLKTVDESGQRDNTILVFTSDHGDMLGSQGQMRKQRPWDEAIRVPFLLRYPKATRKDRTIDMPINTPDIMPTLLGLSGLPIPATVQGDDFSALIRGASAPEDNPVLFACLSPFGEWTRDKGGREYRGVRTRRHSFVRDLQGPWLLYDNDKDPFQLDNLVNKPAHAGLQAELDSALHKLLDKTHDDFQPGKVYIDKWGYAVDKNGTVPYK
jgi:arylsulfatase A-like enzyme